MKRNSKQPVTREEVEEIVDKKFEQQKYWIEDMFTKQKYWIEDMLTQVRSDFFTKIDPFLKEIEDAREHRIIATHETNEIKVQLDDHEKRLTQLEPM